jgi:DNA anti-recombination protein RmuC
MDEEFKQKVLQFIDDTQWDMERMKERLEERLDALEQAVAKDFETLQTEIIRVQERTESVAADVDSIVDVLPEKPTRTKVCIF